MSLIMIVVENVGAKVNSFTQNFGNNEVEKLKPKCGSINNDQDLNGPFNRVIEL